jgi:hypothetical protein
MQKKLWPCILLLSLNLFAREGDPYVEKLWDKHYLKLSDEKEIILVSLEALGGEPNYYRLFMRNGKKVLWDKIFTQEYGTLWNRANFIPLTPNKFIEDLNDDGFSEIAVATSHGGQAVWSNIAVIFSIKNDQLEFLKTFPINIEFSRSIYKTKADFNDSKFKCEFCH